MSYSCRGYSILTSTVWSAHSGYAVLALLHHPIPITESWTIYADVFEAHNFNGLSLGHIYRAAVMREELIAL
jgi:hypothetical protein